MGRTGDGEIADQFVCVWGVDDVVDEVDFGIFTSDDGGRLFKGEFVESSRGLKGFWVLVGFDVERHDALSLLSDGSSSRHVELCLACRNKAVLSLMNEKILRLGFYAFLIYNSISPHYALSDRTIHHFTYDIAYYRD